MDDLYIRGMNDQKTDKTGFVSQSFASSAFAQSATGNDNVPPVEGASERKKLDLNRECMKIMKAVGPETSGSTLLHNLALASVTKIGKEANAKMVCLIRRFLTNGLERPATLTERQEKILKTIEERSSCRVDTIVTHFGSGMGIGVQSLAEELGRICYKYGELAEKSGVINLCELKAQTDGTTSPSEPVN